MVKKAVFIDRDGVINPHVYYADTDEYESPRTPEEYKIYEHVPKALEMLKNAGYILILVSNQPSYAKGKMTWDDVKKIEAKLEDIPVPFDETCYCYHHPEAALPELKIKCRCRKPGTLFPETAVAKYNLDAAQCFFVGDQDSDILCGQKMGFKTIKIQNENSAHKSGKANPDFFAKDLAKAAEIITDKH